MSCFEDGFLKTCQDALNKIPTFASFLPPVFTLENVSPLAQGKSILTENLKKKRQEKKLHKTELYTAFTFLFSFLKKWKLTLPLLSGVRLQKFQGIVIPFHLWAETFVFESHHL